MRIQKNLQKYRQIIEEAVAGIGRDDVGVGEIGQAAEGVLAVTFSRGTHSYTAALPIDKLEGREQARQTVGIALLTLSKRVAQDALAGT